MKKQDFLGYLITIYASFTAIILFLFIVAFQLLPEKGVYEFLKDHGSLIAGFVAFGAAFIALYSQREATRNQASIQFTIEDNRLFVSKLEELYDVIERLRLKAMLIRTDSLGEVVQEIESLYLDLGRASMICRIHKVISQELFEGYREDTEDFIVSWSRYASKIIKGGHNINEARDFELKFGRFKNQTNKVLQELIKNSANYPAP